MVIIGYVFVVGIVLVIFCDYWVMVEGEKYIIGLNEILVNIGLFEDVINGYIFWLGEGIVVCNLL